MPVPSRPKDELQTSSRKKKCRRSKADKNRIKNLTIMYANVQGVRGKKTSLKHTMGLVDADIALLTETMTRLVSIEGCQCINPKISVGQNVSIALTNAVKDHKKMKLFEPNETVNMLGIRLEIYGVGLRLYTAHLKQQSTNTRNEINDQFDEIRNQFRSANQGREPMLLVCDANVHVGSDGVKNCKDAQDWGGKMLLSMLKDEGLVLLNDVSSCKGVVTRVDPRNGHKSTIDLAICNTFMLPNVKGMAIDECGVLKLKRYGTKTTETDHNTIVIQLAVEHSKVLKQCSSSNEKIFNLRNTDERSKLQQLVENSSLFDDLFNDIETDINLEVETLFKRWQFAMEQSFHVVKPSKTMVKGVDAELKELLDKEKWIRENIKENPERGRQIAIIQKEISAKIAANIEIEVESKVNGILHSSNPHSKVFAVRKKQKSNTNIDFPLRDKNGVVQVSKEGVDGIITEHFQKVFKQNDVPNDDMWREYWSLVDEVFSLMDKRTRLSGIVEEPTFTEIETIIKDLKTNKATYGCLTIDLVKLGGKKLAEVIHRCILKCIRLNTLPVIFREEKMTLLLKNNGTIDNINDYRGIFLRNIILSILQKWLYNKNAGKVDSNGSEYACGGRKERSVQEALLIVKLIQDYSNWTKKQVIIEFLDVEKFFDSMNFKKALVEAYNFGVRGSSWQCYKTINEEKVCVPCIPSGQCSPIQVKNVFAQGSCDAVLMAWPLMDADSKRSNDPFKVDCCFEGIPINRISFVDDLSQFTKCEDDTNERNVDNEVFEKKNRLKFKVPKCKVMSRIKEELNVLLDNELVEVVENHIYLGTIISRNGERVEEMRERLKKTNSVANEIVQICKETELSRIRLRYVKLLINACLDSKCKFGCALWNVAKTWKAIDDLNRIKPRLLKRVLEVPLSTPNIAVQYEFGITDLSLDVLSEKIIMAVKTLQLDENRIARQLFERMFEKEVKGFCSEVRETCQVFGVSFPDLLEKENIREYMKEKTLEVQGRQLLEMMLVSSKMDRILVNGFKFDGKSQVYLSELDFREARAIFLARYRMLPVKMNFPGRWKGEECNICGFKDTDTHIFTCPGYVDLNPDGICLQVFWDVKYLSDMIVLSHAAKTLIKLIDRMEKIQNLV